MGKARRRAIATTAPLKRKAKMSRAQLRKARAAVRCGVVALRSASRQRCGLHDASSHEVDNEERGTGHSLEYEYAKRELY